MVRSEVPEPAGDGQSLGDLVALAAKDVSQLIRYEIDLAKTELKGDVQRIGLAGALGVVAAFVACLVLVLLSIALAFDLVVLGAGSEASRASESQKLLNYGFQFYDTVQLYQNGQSVPPPIRVWKGAEDSVSAGFVADLRRQNLFRQGDVTCTGQVLSTSVGGSAAQFSFTKAPAMGLP